jgi:hypothetical protein
MTQTHWQKIKDIRDDAGMTGTRYELIVDPDAGEYEQTEVERIALPDGSMPGHVWQSGGRWLAEAQPVGPRRTRIDVVGDEVRITYPDGETRAYRTVGQENGYVYDISDLPGASGHPLLDPRGPTGTTLTGPRDGKALADLLRRCLRAARRQAVRRGCCEANQVRL